MKQVYSKLSNAVNVLCVAKGKDCLCTSGYRSGAKQKIINAQVLAQCSTNYQKSNGAVYNKAGQCLAAAYGTSNHCFGMALDISDPWFKALTNAELAKYGLIKPMNYEPWHVELIETRGLSAEQKPIFYFQYTHGLVADGIAGPKTRAKMAEIKKVGSSMKWIETRKSIALFLTLIFGILTVMGFYMGKDIPTAVTPIISMIIGFYFGKSTALDKPE